MNPNILYILNCVATAFVNSGWKEESGDNSDAFIQEMFKRYGGASSRYGAYCVVGVSNILQTVSEVLASKNVPCNSFSLPVRYTDRNTNKSTILEGNVAATLAALIKSGQVVKTITDGAMVKPGMVFFRPSLNGYNHTGIVIDVNAITGEVITCEANVSTSGVDNIRNGFQFIAYSRQKFQEWNNQKFKEIPSGIKKILLPETTLDTLLTSRVGSPMGWKFWMPFENCTAPEMALQTYPVLGLRITCNPVTPPSNRTTTTTFSTCKDVPMPPGNGWEQTGDNVPDASDGYEYSQPDYCYRRKKVIATTCATSTSPGKGWEKTPDAFLQTLRKPLGMATVIGEFMQYNFSSDYCWRKKKDCPIITDKQTCDPKQVVKVYASTFDSKSVPHYSTLIGNNHLAADIVKAMEYLKQKPEFVGSAVQAPKVVVDNGQVNESLVSGFGTFSDKNGNLFVIVHEANEAKIKSLTGDPENKKLPLLRSAYVIVVEGRDNGGIYQREIEAHWCSGNRQDKYGSSETLGVKRWTSVHDKLYSEYSKYSKLIKDGKNPYYFQMQRIVDTEKKAIDYINKNPGSYEQFTALNLTDGEGVFLVQSQDSRREGLLNLIEDTQRKYDKPILIIIAKAPPKISFWESFSVFLNVVSSLAVVVGVPPGIITSVLGATKTLTQIAQGDGNVIGNAFKLAGVLTSFMPADLRGNIEDLIPNEFRTTVNDVQKFITEQGKIVGNYLASAQQYVSEIQNSNNILGSASKLFVPNFNIQQFGTNALSGLLFNGKEIRIENLAPKWADFIKVNAATAQQAGSSYAQGQDFAVKMLHNLELMKVSQQFVRTAESGSLKTDITDRGSFLGNPIMQNMLYSGALGAVAASMPGTTDIIANIMKNASGDIENETELAALIKIGMGYQPSPGDLSRMVYQSVANRLFDVRDKVDQFVLPPSFSLTEQECVAKDLADCFGIEIIPPDPRVPPVKPPTVKPPDTNNPPNNKNNPPITDTPSNNPPNTKNNPPITDNPFVPPVTDKPKVTLPKCIVEDGNSFWYCPPTTCATDTLKGLGNVVAPLTTTTFSLAPVSSLPSTSLNTVTVNPGNTLTVNPVTVNTSNVPTTNTVITTTLKPNTNTVTTNTVNPNTNTVTVKPNTNTTTNLNTTTANANKPNTDLQTLMTKNGCTYLYEARVDVNGNWYANIKGTWTKIIDCCPPVVKNTTTPPPSTDCCDSTKLELQNVYAAIAKLQELILRKNSGEVSAPCDTSSIKQDIANISNQIRAIQMPNFPTSEISALRSEIAELRSFVANFKQQDYAREFSELRSLIQAIQVCDTSSLHSEIQQMKSMLMQSNSQSDREFIAARFNSLERLIAERKNEYQKDYSNDFQNLQNQYDNLQNNLAILKDAIKSEISKKQAETQYNPIVQTDIDSLQKMLKEQQEEYGKRLGKIQEQLNTMPKCEECEQLEKVLKEIRELKQSSKNSYTNTQQAVQEKQSSTSSEKTIDGDCPDCPKMIIYDYPQNEFHLGNRKQQREYVSTTNDCDDCDDCDDC